MLVSDATGRSLPPMARRDLSNMPWQLLVHCVGAVQGGCVLKPIEAQQVLVEEDDSNVGGIPAKHSPACMNVSDSRSHCIQGSMTVADKWQEISCEDPAGPQLTRVLD